jgi:uncharacterized protein (DUF1330 family)
MPGEAANLCCHCIRKINDADSFKEVVPKYPALVAAAGGHYVARTAADGEITALDGIPPQRVILIAFDSAEKAQAWHNSAGVKGTGRNPLEINGLAFVHRRGHALSDEGGLAMHRAGLALLAGWVIGLPAIGAMSQGVIAIPPWMVVLHLLALPVGVFCLVLSEPRSADQIPRRRP